MNTKEQALIKVQELVKRFNEQYPAYKKTEYNETQTRRDFIDPMFKALGWDIDNENAYGESYREVIHEDKVKIGSATKAPDYSFRLGGGKRLFFVEAKKPSVTIKDDIYPAYQVRRYGWSAKLNLSIITDFEEFAIYDCTKKPNPTDKASVARVKYITFGDYEKEWDFLWDTFSKESVLKGNLDRFISGTANKKGTATVDKEFLNSLDQWRSLLAEIIAKENRQLNEDELNFIVQQTLDRIIFLRIAEDRSIEPYGSLKECLGHGIFFQNLFKLFQQADAKYNSGLFAFKKDPYSKDLLLNNKTLKTIINQLYYPECPYEFSVLSVEILGSAYEQFLGKTITINNRGKAVTELKPEVRKAGGVYYTPQYIVDYIVENTVGKLCDNKTPKEVSEIKIVDPACGSGSFLLGAYQYLLNWHKDYYTASPNIANRKNLLTPEGNLTTAEKKRILLNNIHGVDIDLNAVEVTKLSLLLKCLEGETQASIAYQMTMFHERVLPTLDDNIKSGNSLIDTDYYDNILDFGEEKKIKPFNWQKAFPEVFKKGGFDAVIGNPPWVDIKGHDPDLVKYYFLKFKTTENRINLYAIFVEQGLKILSFKGIIGFIIPNSILYQSSYELLRKVILQNNSIEQIIRLPDNVFQNVKAETIILTISNQPTLTDCTIYDRKSVINEISHNNCDDFKKVDSKRWLNNELFVFDIFNGEEEISLLNKIELNKHELTRLCDFSLGITPYDKYKGHSESQIKNRVFHSKTKENDTYKPLLEGSDVTRYKVIWGGKEYLSYGSWLGAPRELRYFTLPRILVRQIVSGNPLRIYAGYSDEELYNTQSIFNIVSKEESTLKLKYLLAILNSSLMNFYHNHKYLDISKNLFQKILIQNCKKFPIKLIDLNNKYEINIQTDIINLVDQLLQLNKDLFSTNLPAQKDQIKRRIDYCEDKINELVYKLYDLTEDEIRIIEGE